jgi:CHAD domain-containing protein
MGRVTTPPAGLRADQSFGEAGRRLIAVRAQELFEHAGGVLDLDQPDGVHDMRVATRRLRAALEMFATSFPHEAHSAVLADVKRLADVLGERRDCDVQLECLARLREEVTRSERGAIDGLLKGLRSEQREANRRLARALQRAERRHLATRLQELSR